MKQLPKITAVISMAAYFYLSLYPIKIFNDLNLDFTNSAQVDSFVVLEKTNGNLSGIQFNKTSEFKVQKFTIFGKLFYKSNSKPHNVLLLKKYIQNNELLFNLPFVCYKFPLSEHTEEG
jgi:hypothetical protein